ncbi:MAG TPA: ribonuclease HII, partial [Salinimicrobium sp.]|nr:ribonuclease HII [Salinimicrobium sp.]
NTLYLISNEGEIFWKKDLDFRILGKIKQVDLYRNGRIQLAFATPHSIHIIDRDGNTVPPFPLEFEDKITQPLAVFDYDSNRKYRFLVVQGKDVFMYNSEGERVTGFTFTEAENEIIKVPKHIRLGPKDYILIAEESGKLNILSRTGKIRVPVEEHFKFSENEWYEYENRFVSTNSEGELLKIDQKGNISEANLNASAEIKIAATAHTLVSLSENKLTINGKTISLDYGLYTQPQIFYLNDKIYVSTTDTQSHRVFLFDGNAQIIPGFPVYGNSKIDLGNADSDANLELAVQGEENAFIIYEISG